MTRTEQFIKLAVKKGYYVDKNGILWRNASPAKTRKPRFGYLTFSVGFMENGKKVAGRCGLHKLQAYQKYGDKIFEPGIVCRHLNDIKLDNSYDNIAIGTKKDNSQDIPPIKRSLLAHKNNVKYDHKAIIADRKAGMSFPDLMKKYNITRKSTVYNIVYRSLYVRKPLYFKEMDRYFNENSNG